jgi:DNA-binding NarL/FixJ family response regulator
MAATPVRLLLVVDEFDARSRMSSQLAAHPECTIVGALSSDDDLSAAAARAHPDAIIWDLGGDPEASLQVLAEAQDLGLPIVAIVQDERDGLRALMLGAKGLLPRADDAERLIIAVRAAVGGLFALDPSVAGFAGSPRHPETDAIAEPLTRRERQVLQLMAEGLANRPIAERLGITEHTAKFHVHTILGKLGTQSRTEAVVRAARLGLITI